MEKNSGSKDSLDSQREKYLSEGELREGGTPSRELSRRLSTTGRRGFLSALASLGISAGSILGLSREALAKENIENSVPFTAKYEVKDVEQLKSRNSGERLETVAKKESVPRGSWERNRAVRNAANRIRNELKNAGTPLRVGVGTNPSGKQIVEVHRPPTNSNGSQLEETINSVVPDQTSAKVQRGKRKSDKEFTNIQIKTKSVSQDPQACDNPGLYDSTYSEVPGGAMATFKDGGYLASAGASGTTATPVYSRDRGQYEILTAGHNFENGNDSLQFKQIHQPCENEGNVIGTYTDHKSGDATYYADYNDDGTNGVTNFDPTTVDAGTFSLRSGYTDEYKLASTGGGFDELIGGYWSWEKILQGVGSWSVEHQGMASGRSSGTVTFADNSANWFVTDKNTSYGDSGGPHFAVDSSNSVNDIKVAGVHSVGVDFNDTGTTEGAGAYAMGRILNDLNLEFI